MNGLDDNLRYRDNGTETRSGAISCSARDASPVIPDALVLVGYGIGPNHHFTVRSPAELRQACIDLADDAGIYARHIIQWGDVPAEARAILDEPCGIECATGDTVADYLATFL